MSLYNRKASVVHIHMHVYVCMYVCMLSTFSNVFSETTGPIKAKFYMEPPWDGGTKVHSNGPDHIPTYGKNIKKSSSLKQKVGDLET